MTELNHWLLLSLLELPEFQLKEFKHGGNYTELTMYLNGKAFNLYIEDVSTQAADRPISPTIRTWLNDGTSTD